MKKYFLISILVLAGCQKPVLFHNLRYEVDCVKCEVIYNGKNGKTIVTEQSNRDTKNHALGSSVIVSFTVHSGREVFLKLVSIDGKPQLMSGRIIIDNVAQESIHTKDVSVEGKIKIPL